MIFYKADENKKVLMHTKSAKSAADYHLTNTCADDGLEQAYDGSWYLKGYAPAKPEPTIEEQVASLEDETGLTRIMREIVLAEGSGASDYVKEKALEIEELAKQLRKEEIVEETTEGIEEEGTESLL